MLGFVLDLGYWRGLFAYMAMDWAASGGVYRCFMGYLWQTRVLVVYYNKQNVKKYVGLSDVYDISIFVFFL